MHLIIAGLLLAAYCAEAVDGEQLSLGYCFVLVMLKTFNQ